MKVVLWITALGLVAWPARAQLGRPEAGWARSLSDQFAVRTVPTATQVERPANLATNQAFIRLEPSLVSVSCERIRQLLCREIQADALWRGKVFVLLHPVGDGTEGVTLTSERFRDGWQYRVDMPDIIERARYVRALVQVVLLEMANRTAGTHSAEIPAWLVEGLSQQLQVTHEAEILIPPARPAGPRPSFTSTVFNGRKQGPLERARAVLAARPALTFEELSWPKADQLSGPDAELYRCSAQLFVASLMEFPNGRTCLQSMLSSLPDSYNWQLAFLQAFHEHFSRPQEVEDWWAEQAAHFSGREVLRVWSPERSQKKVEEALFVTVETKPSTNAVPSRTLLPLQTVLREWEGTRLTEALLGRIQEFASLRPKLTSDWAGLADDYRRVLTNFLRQRDRHHALFPLNRHPAYHRLVEETAYQLDLLDVRRQSLRPEPSAAPLSTQARF